MAMLAAVDSRRKHYWGSVATQHALLKLLGCLFAVALDPSISKPVWGGVEQ